MRHLAPSIAAVAGKHCCWGGSRGRGRGWGVLAKARTVKSAEARLLLFWEQGIVCVCVRECREIWDGVCVCMCAGSKLWRHVGRKKQSRFVHTM